LEKIIVKNVKIYGIVRKWIAIIEVRIGFRSYEYSSGILRFVKGHCILCLAKGNFSSPKVISNYFYN
jgi:hypothetical protein